MDSTETLKELREAVRSLNSKLDALLYIRKTGDETSYTEIEAEKNLIRRFYKEHREIIEMMKRTGELK